jgi:hypothetical protein
MFAPAIWPVDPDLKVLSCDMGVACLSEDGGQTWQPFNDLPFANIQRVEPDPGDDARIYVATFGGSVWHGPAQ